MVETGAVQRSARGLVRVLTGIQVALGLGGAAMLVTAANWPLALGGWLGEGLGFALPGMGVWQALGLILLASGQVAVWLVAVTAMRAIFAALDWLDPAGAALAARRTARWLWVVLAYGMVAQSAGSVLASWHYPEGERALSITLGSTQLSIALTALVAAFLARAFALGAELWADHRSVI